MLLETMYFKTFSKICCSHKIFLLPTEYCGRHKSSKNVLLQWLIVLIIVFTLPFSAITLTTFSGIFRPLCIWTLLVSYNVGFNALVFDND